MATNITFDDLPNATYTVELEGVVFKINMRYNPIDDGWYFTLRDADGDNLLSSIRVTINNLVLQRFRRTTFPDGDFVFLLDTASRDPQRNDILDLTLVYLTEAEVEQIST